MRITSLKIENFRGIKSATLTDLGDTVVVAGPNGCGKSCVFDAIRMLKSIYGGYQPNEWHRWMNEFQLPQENGRFNMRPLLNDATKTLRVECEFALHQDERQVLRVLGEQEIRRVLNPAFRRHASALGSALPRLVEQALPGEDLEARIQTNIEQLRDELSRDRLLATVATTPDGEIEYQPILALELMFSTYRPRQLGLIDYHGPQRFFQRETVQQLSVNLDAHKQQQIQHALYDTNNKYLNVKAEMAASYVQEILAERAGVVLDDTSNLTVTLQELFSTFFPHKTFAGPIPNQFGLLEFPVTTLDGSTHDLNELSAGEKEILYGYLRIRNSAPRYSIILLDEPELHLNPQLIRSLPGFYRKHLGEALDNQIWLITHSDALIREVAGNADYSVFHMTPAHVIQSEEGQARRLQAAEDVEQVVIDLVGDLASYRPGGKVVLFEGGGDSEFDVSLTRRLFPEFAEAVNPISAGSKTRVRNLHDVLDRASAAGTIPFKIFSIIDRDADNSPVSGNGRYVWEAYHIENYLLEPNIIADVLRSLEIGELKNPEAVSEALRDAAREAMTALIVHQLTRFSSQIMIPSIDLGFDPNSVDPALSLHKAIDRSINKIGKESENKLSLRLLRKEEERLRGALYDDLSTDRWRSTFRGRDILKRFAGKYVQGMSYNQFRALIVSRMVESNYRPIEMGRVIAKILAA